MARYFIELAYKGTNYKGFQVQENANTVQAEVDRAFATLQRQAVSLTGSSRTDTGVHALQNYFHFDTEMVIHPQFVYKMNAILPGDIAVRNIYQMPDGAHARFDAISREYRYNIHRRKDPFLESTSFFFPYKLDVALMQEAAAYVLTRENFFAFAKTNSQVNNFNCKILQCKWEVGEDQLSFCIEANRFLRGMVRLLTGTMLKLGRHKIDMEDFKKLFDGDQKSGFSVPAQGLFLRSVHYPGNYFPAPGLHLTPF